MNLNTYNSVCMHLKKKKAVNKFQHKNTKKITSIKSTTLNIKNNTVDIKTLAKSFFALELLVFKHSKPVLTKKQSISLKLKKKQPIGCLVVMKKMTANLFLSKTLEILPKTKVVILTKPGFNSFEMSLHNITQFSELEEYYSVFKNLQLNISVNLTAKNKNENLFFLKMHKIPLKLLQM